MAVAPVALAFRAWLRRRWRAGAGLALLLGLASPGGSLGTTTDRVRILAGRRPPGAAPADVVIDPQLAAQQGLSQRVVTAGGRSAQRSGVVGESRSARCRGKLCP